MTKGISENELHVNDRPPLQPPHSDRQLYPMVLSMKIMSASAWFQCTAIALYMCMHCFRYPGLLLGNKVSDPNAAAIMLLWWSKMTILCLDKIEHLKKYSSCFAPNTNPFNPYKPSVLFVGHQQTVQNQIRRRKTRRLIRFSTVYLQKFSFKI